MTAPLKRPPIRIVEKSPKNVFRIRFLRALFPDARFLHLDAGSSREYRVPVPRLGDAGTPRPIRFRKGSGSSAIREPNGASSFSLAGVDSMATRSPRSARINGVRATTRVSPTGVAPCRVRDEDPIRGRGRSASRDAPFDRGLGGARSGPVRSVRGWAGVDPGDIETASGEMACAGTGDRTRPRSGRGCRHPAGLFLIPTRARARCEPRRRAACESRGPGAPRRRHRRGHDAGRRGAPRRAGEAERPGQDIDQHDRDPRADGAADKQQPSTTLRLDQHQQPHSRCDEELTPSRSVRSARGTG